MKVAIPLLLFVTLFVAGTLSQVDPNDEEGDVLSCIDPNEEPLECGPACGDRTCSNQRRNNVLCSRQCIAGCFCRGGYVRNSRNICIPSFMCFTG
ncbi:chymotrypsin-elastase inhibitor ixodidin-like [Anopheles maculipalpis]|uniref:chymotrypsin-elastase inhibitor ixodidin-like n=1 Tax=Anopheles maculipalpis TaxID=1496333 RepID=UPI002159A2AF|nr:chymotrypsin-elastase inhibitor ixodidin-like [Anopheles maculipalpis]